MDDGVARAWFVNDREASFSSNIHRYFQTLTASEVVTAATVGWRLSATVRVVGPFPDQADPSVFVAYWDGTREWMMRLGAAANGDPVLRLFSADTTPNFLTHTVTGGADGYHTYEMVYDPGTATVDVLVDGVEVMSLGYWPGDPEVMTAQVAWGASSSPTTGHGRFSAVSFSIAFDPIAAIERLIDHVLDLDLPQGTENSLRAKLNAALSALTDPKPGNDGAAVNVLEAFMNAVESSKKLTPDEAAVLATAAQSIIDCLENG